MNNREVNIPFQPEFKDSMLAGNKTATTRTSRFGRPGDWFPAFGRIFVLTEVYQIRLSLAIYRFHQDEGFSSPGEFINCWDRLHPRVTYAERRARLVYLHRFTITQKAYPQTRTVESHMPLAGVAHPK